eukprot:COSAG02_NODE_2170_length_9599_cov_5.637789_5_plen_229_part_00
MLAVPQSTHLTPTSSGCAPQTPRASEDASRLARNYLYIFNTDGRGIQPTRFCAHLGCDQRQRRSTAAPRRWISRSAGVPVARSLPGPVVHEPFLGPTKKRPDQCEMSNPFGYAPADSEVGSKYGNTSGTHVETVYPVTEMLHSVVGHEPVFHIKEPTCRRLNYIAQAAGTAGTTEQLVSDFCVACVAKAWWVLADVTASQIHRWNGGRNGSDTYLPWPDRSTPHPASP